MPARTLTRSPYAALTVVSVALMAPTWGCSSDGEAANADEFGYGAGGDGWAPGAGGNAAFPPTPGMGGANLPPPPVTCGNGALDINESCDGGNLNGQSCASMTMNAQPDGALRCTTSCTFDTSGCTGGVGAGGAPGTGGAVNGTGGMDGFGGDQGAGGDQGVAGAPGAGGSTGTGACCSSGDCLCHGPDPTGLTSRAGTFTTATFTVPAGTVHYPTNAEPPFAGVAICPGFTNTGPEMAPWGPFYASHGIVTVVTNTLGGDFPDIRATKLLAAVDQLKAENTKAGSALFGKMSDRYGTSGYSMGGGGTTIASTRVATLRTSIGLAAWGPATSGIRVPTLLLCGSADTVAPCSQSLSAYNGIAAGTSKMMVTIAGATHFNWFGPTSAGGGVSGETALAFQKVYLEGDERWLPILKQSRGTVQTNIP